VAARKGGHGGNRPEARAHRVVDPAMSVVAPGA
jgi:hypothetical protein